MVLADEYDEKITLKVPSNVIKSIISECRMDFLFGKDSIMYFRYYTPVHVFMMIRYTTFG